ncbi:hypothetical protein Lalb_Chr01g0002361 [Lupinus albus]|uniref:Uncharacterized protein n=1 Tax=Lupinus albus TaxID=3870 RepID=A0A6A4R2W0_LUPAL|nr:hypothetical protein Lalb_Chr01g0002361 [Lupinus albus]
MAVVMGIVTMVRLTKNMPKNIAAVRLYCESAVYYSATMMNATPTISIDDHTAMMKRMAELEEKVNVLNMRPLMPLEKEELLNNALSRVTTLEQELASSKKALDYALAKQVELQAYIDMKNKKKKLVCHSNFDTDTLLVMHYFQIYFNWVRVFFLTFGFVIAVRLPLVK